MGPINYIVSGGPLGLYAQHLIFFITYEWAQKVRLFVSDRPFRFSLFVIKAGAYPSEALLRCFTLGRRLGPYSQQ